MPPRAKPSHRIYAVTQGRTRWTDIGAAWIHKDRNGFDLRLETVPLTAAEIIVRPNRAEIDPPATYR
jgi:hypothetical protein